MAKKGKKAKQNAKRPAEKVSYSSSRKHRAALAPQHRQLAPQVGQVLMICLVQKCDMCS